MNFDPEKYRKWFETPLGRTVDADEKGVLFSLADLKPGERVLDIGCGDGAFTEVAARLTGQAVGLDSSREMLNAAKNRLSHLSAVKWVEGDATALPFPDATFDVVLAVAMLGMMPDPLDVVREARRVLKPDGRMILADLNRWSAWAAERRIRGRLKPGTVWGKARFFSANDLRGLLSDAGFSDILIRGAVYYAPIDSAFFLRLMRPVERLGQTFNLPFPALIIARGQLK